jgi:hypothetical protein
MDISYKEVYAMSKEEARRRIVETYMPHKIAPEVEEKVLEARKKTGYGRKRLAWYLAREEDLVLSPHTLRHILNRNGFKGKRSPRKTFYPAHWTWEEGQPFSLAQVVTSDILDKGTLGTKIWTHIEEEVASVSVDIL